MSIVYEIEKLRGKSTKSTTVKKKESQRNAKKTKVSTV